MRCRGEHGKKEKRDDDVDEERERRTTTQETTEFIEIKLNMMERSVVDSFVGVEAMR
jgi:hypothetical protein